MLDIGCGSARDLAALHTQGLQVTGIDASDQMLIEARQHHPELAGRLHQGALPDSIPDLPDAPFDNILLNAVLMHIPDGDLFSTALTIKGLLKPEGQLVVSIPTERDDTDSSSGRDKYDRLMILRSEAAVSLLFERLGFRKTAAWHSNDQLGRSGISWVTIQFRLSSEGIARPVARIESIINTDKKTATYKLALLRACCDIAQRESGRVAWHPDGRARLPMESLVERWTEYYWPIMASSRFVAQNQGEAPDCAKPVSFRRSLTGLVDHYRSQGGYSAFTEDLRSSDLEITEKQLWSPTRTAIRNAIIKGPVYYAKGAADGSRPFEYDKQSGSVLLSADLWREFSLLGHWIRDSLLLRWAEETDRMSNGDIPVGDALALLLSDLQPERDQNRVRSAFLEIPGLECVWSGKSLKPKTLHIDHAIPFSLWRDNSLWNLLPADEKVNSSKSDKLPTLGLLRRRRDNIIGSWRTTNFGSPVRFANEASTLLGRTPGTDWEQPLFQALMEAVEVTATRRGIERWEPA